VQEPAGAEVVAAWQQVSGATLLPQSNAPRLVSPLEQLTLQDLPWPVHEAFPTGLVVADVPELGLQQVSGVTLPLQPKGWPKSVSLLEQLTLQE
jgi:hypothetical protein